MADTEVTREIDTGASVSLISVKEWTTIKESAPQLTMNTTIVSHLSSMMWHYSSVSPTAAGDRTWQSSSQLSTRVVPGLGPNIVGRDWPSVLKQNWATRHHVNNVNGQADPLAYFPELFQVQWRVRKLPDAKPVFCKSRSVPCLMENKVDDELDRLLNANIIEAVA